MPRSKSTVFDDLALAPWPVGVLMGSAILAAGRWGPSLLVGVQNPLIAGFGKQLAAGALAPLFWFAAALCWAAAGVSAWRRAQRRKLLDSRTGLDSLRAMSWRQLEALVAEAYQRLGFQVEENHGRGADGGVDLRLRRSGGLTLVQCKHWRIQRVGAPVVREQFGLLAHHGAAHVVIVTTGDFTAQARAFARGKPIELVAGPELLALVRSVQRHRGAVIEAPIVEQVAEGCPLCGSPMVRRTARKSGAVFLGCASSPACRGTRAV